MEILPDLPPSEKDRFYNAIMGTLLDMRLFFQSQIRLADRIVKDAEKRDRLQAEKEKEFAEQKAEWESARARAEAGEIAKRKLEPNG